MTSSKPQLLPSRYPIRGDELRGLTAEELELFHYLRGRERGRLEQEFLAKDLVEDAVCEWAS